MENKFILFHGRMLNKELIKCAYLQSSSDKLFPDVRPVVEFINDSNIIPVGNFTDDYESAMEVIYELYSILGGNNIDIENSKQQLFKKEGE